MEHITHLIFTLLSTWTTRRNTHEKYAECTYPMAYTGDTKKNKPTDQDNVAASMAAYKLKCGG